MASFPYPGYLNVTILPPFTYTPVTVTGSIVATASISAQIPAAAIFNSGATGGTISIIVTPPYTLTGTDGVANTYTTTFRTAVADSVVAAITPYATRAAAASASSAAAPTRSASVPAPAPPSPTPSASLAPISSASPIVSQSLVTTTSAASSPPVSSTPGATAVPVVQGFSAGAVGGAAAGAGVGAALIAFLVAWLCFRSRSKKSQKNERGPSGQGYAAVPAAIPKEKPDDSGSSGATSGFMAAGGAYTWQKHLPQAEDDATMRSKVSTMFDQVTLHVDNFYLDQAVELTGEIKGNLERLDFGNLPGSIINMFPETRFPVALIKHCMVSEIIARISPTGGYAETFLPDDFVALPQSINAGHGNRAQPRVFDQAFSQWRVLTAYLRPNPVSDEMYQSHVKSIIDEVAMDLVRTFAPWANPNYTIEERTRRLTAVMRSAAQTGVLIFSQPTTFNFRWTGNAQSSLNRGGVEITPSFVKTRDEEGKELSFAQVLVQGRVENT